MSTDNRSHRTVIALIYCDITEEVFVKTILSQISREYFCKYSAERKSNFTADQCAVTPALSLAPGITLTPPKSSRNELYYDVGHVSRHLTTPAVCVCVAGATVMRNTAYAISIWMHGRLQPRPDRLMLVVRYNDQPAY